MSTSRDAQLTARAAKVIPNGMWGHMATRSITAGYPQFFQSAQGCRVTDVDGREFIDFMCAWGPNVLGYQNERVDQAALAQLARVDSGNGPTEALVELAELLVSTLDNAAWAMLQKNGSDATTVCVTVARAATQRRKLVVVRGAYHGAVPWCSPSLVGVTAEDRAHILYCEWNDPASLEAAVAEAGDDLAGIMITAFRHDLGRDQEMPTVEFLSTARALCDKKDALLILDDVRAGFRLDVRGSWAAYGVSPDLAAYSKAIANGWPLAAVVGSERAREGAGKIFTTGSFWYGAASHAAAIETIKILRDTDALAHTFRMGDRFRAGLDRVTAVHGLKLRQTGPSVMPMVLFEGDADLKIGNAFCLAALNHGVYLHPKHNMFLSAAHTEADIDQALAAAELALQDIARAGVIKG
ncbi:aminotransferase class III-fold pyridoxal phosphate-dependent enzyme [Xinfangfangia sp. CPCC 101601]|uniref:Aminotransferase class III-fold pyridoxal phosphate-dependent enzyme n=1 Tax=Pseudogemmobacter lacusdianii TaxID=3069608 RepID=A0ABU0W1H8_9RHOB|nr:aminotransferase class III-fold pyridoxal phosphate-dependent enzyme [Xinfangfangia sp. CPCC 101601]MDQ2067876.1 aminotransferase class III-fold pyridoxal phosphate-dependent enzyme [Xinfangfangia sp. CPCC 101601]